MRTYRNSLFAAFFAAFVFHAQAGGQFLASTNPVRTQINWPEFLAQHDLVWEDLPHQWSEGAFCGNGQLGMMVYATLDDNRIDFHLGRQDVTDHRKAPDRKTSMGVPGASVMTDYCRLDIGRMALRPAGKILSGTVRQDLWNAEICGKIITDLGTITFRAFTPRDRMFNVIEIQSTEEKDGKSVDCRWQFLPGNPASPRAQVVPERCKGYVTNPNPVLEKDGDVSVCIQPLSAGGDYATAWVNKKSVLYVSTANEIPASSRSAAITIVRNASKENLSALETPHRDWWHRYYQKSFLTIPDAKMESFYWIQLYKMAAVSRADGPAVDLFGPFFKMTQWPGLWWNLNVQLTYWPYYKSNHSDLALSLNRLVEDEFDSLLNVRFAKRMWLGDLTWAMHNVWLYYRHAGDWNSIQEKWAPLAARVVEAYKEVQQTNSPEQIELLPMGSPEYHGFKTFRNTNYNLALLRWMLGALIESNEKAGGYPDDVARWKQMRSSLIPYPVDENGLMIGSDQPFDMAHRHFSHLIAVYPLFLLTRESSPENIELANRSVDHWLSYRNADPSKGYLTGYTYTVAASMYAVLGRPDEGLGMLQQFLANEDSGSMLLPNTFYAECSGRSPTIETPLSAANSMMDFLLQDWGGKIRIFPAVPSAWKDAAFYQLRAKGGFLVSASLRNGKPKWIAVKSLAGEPCVITVPGGNEIPLELKAGEEIVLMRGPGGAAVEPVEHDRSEWNPYGIKKGQHLPTKLDWPVPAFNPF